MAHRAFDRRNSEWSLAFGFLMTVVSVARIVGIAADGVVSGSVRPLVVELLLVVIAVLARRGAVRTDGAALEGRGTRVRTGTG